MSYDFDRVLDRSQSSSTKWSKFAPDVLPMWVADMDFAAPDFIVDSLRHRLAHPVLGYTDKPPELVEAFTDWLQYHFGWTVQPEWLVWLPGVVPGLNLACQSIDSADVLVPTPVYHPFLDLGAHAGCRQHNVPMARDGRQWAMDFDAMQAALTPDTRMLLICNPQNPTGRVYSGAELDQLREFVERHQLLLVSDEIHCNIVLDGSAQHVPFAHRHADIADQTISLFAATKAYNIPGVSCAVAVIPDAGVRARFVAARRGLVPGIGPLGFAASTTAFADRSDYLPDLVAYLRGNLARVSEVVGPRLAHLQGTYLAWIDVGDLQLDDTEAHFAAHGLGINPGAMFGDASHVRLNFGCPRSTLDEGLRRLVAGLA